MMTSLNPKERLEKYLHLLGYACLLFSAIQVWEYWTYKQFVVESSAQITDWRFYNILFVFFMGALAGIFLIQKPAIGIKIFHALALPQLAILFLLSEQMLVGKSSIVFYVPGLLFYWKLFAKIKKSEYSDPSS